MNYEQATRYLVTLVPFLSDVSSIFVESHAYSCPLCLSCCPPSPPERLYMQTPPKSQRYPERSLSKSVHGSKYPSQTDFVRPDPGPNSFIKCPRSNLISMKNKIPDNIIVVSTFEQFATQSVVP